MLKRHLACINLAKNALTINDEDVPFLPEHELPANARLEPADEQAASSTSSAQPQAAAQPKPPQSTPAAQPAATPTFPEPSIKVLMDLGFTRQQAIVALEATKGNTELAANLLFQQD
jgi:DNA damage-inducible protein 1